MENPQNPADIACMNRVVVIDDYEPALKVYATVIKRLLGSDVVPFSNPREAMQYIATMTPSLIILDYNMPEINGVQFTVNVRNSTKLRGVPIIMCTGSNDLAVQSRAIDAGV